MTPSRIFWALSVLSFIVSCVNDFKGNDVRYARFLFLAYGMMLCGWGALFHEWGLLP